MTLNVRNSKMDLFISKDVFMYPKMIHYEKTSFEDTTTLLLRDIQASIKHRNLLLEITPGLEYNRTSNDTLKDVIPVKPPNPSELALTIP